VGDFTPGQGPLFWHHQAGTLETKRATIAFTSRRRCCPYEEAAYQTVGIGRLQEILDAIGIKTVVTLKRLQV